MQNKSQQNSANDISNNDLPKFLTQAEAAKILCKHPRWLELKRCEGGGPLFRYIGRTPMYDLKDLLAWINEQPVINNTSCH